MKESWASAFSSDEAVDIYALSCARSRAISYYYHEHRQWYCLPRRHNPGRPYYPAHLTDVCYLLDSYEEDIANTHGDLPHAALTTSGQESATKYREGGGLHSTGTASKPECSKLIYIAPADPVKFTASNVGYAGRR